MESSEARKKLVEIIFGRLIPQERERQEKVATILLQIAEEREAIRFEQDSELTLPKWIASAMYALAGALDDDFDIQERQRQLRLAAACIVGALENVTDSQT